MELHSVFFYQSAISEEYFMFISHISGNKTKEGVVSGVNTVAQRTTDQANIVGETAVGSTNEVGQKTVEGLENVAASTGLVNPGDFSHGGMEGGDGGEGY
ncbi:synuclein-like [Sinocyclocheilus rhinocerous]|uniref:synuclein-like n=1 Tax=Sinocyclocheilus rhinocerous TaxID=307959 RepID=UPI0007B903E4|nr:PREDICTED: synuclein-like [Sinocyclocheilus rhinocerous]